MKALKKYAPFVAIGAALLALILYVFAPVLQTVTTVVEYDMSVSETSNVWDSLTSGADKVTMIVITVVASVIALAGTVLAYFKDKISFLKGKENIVDYVVAGVLALTAILCFSAKGFIITDMGTDNIKIIEEMMGVSMKFVLGIGAILGGILNIVAAAAIVVPKFLKD